MTVCVCLSAPLACLWGAGISWFLHCLVPSFRSFSSAAASTETTGCSVFKSLVCHLNEAFGAKKEKKRKRNSTWKYHNVLNISLHLTGMFWEYVGSPFWVVIFPCVFSNCYLPTGHRGLLLRKKRHEIDIIPLNAAQIYRENTVIHWQCLKIKHILLLSPSLSVTSYSLHFSLNLLFNY